MRVRTLLAAAGPRDPGVGIAAGTVAGRLGGPVLLTARASLPAAAKNELARLRPDTAVVAGGESVVSRTAYEGVLGVAWP